MASILKLYSETGETSIRFPKKQRKLGEGFWERCKELDLWNGAVHGVVLCRKDPAFWDKWHEFAQAAGKEKTWRTDCFLQHVSWGQCMVLRHGNAKEDDSAEDEVRIHLALLALRLRQPPEAVWRGFDSCQKVWGRTWQCIASFSTADLSGDCHVGHALEKERRCRFCGRMCFKGGFEKRAHAISEGLGNKHLFLWDECDECNGGQIQKLEQSLFAFLEPLRSVFGVEGKHGIPKVEKPSLQIDREEPGTANLVLKIETGLGGNDGTWLGTPFATSPFVPADVYRLLCKYALSVLPVDEFDFVEFGELRDWIGGKKTGGARLPLVAWAIDNRLAPYHPSIAVFKRTDPTAKDDPLYLCMLSATGTRFVFELPFTGNGFSLATEEDWKRFFKRHPPFAWGVNWMLEHFEEEEQRCENRMIVRQKG